MERVLADPAADHREERDLAAVHLRLSHGVVTYWVVLSIQTAIRNYARFQERAQAALRSDLRASQLETQVAQARLGALKAQLQPHFLFNTLNAIVVLVRQQKGQQAEETLARFSDLLRAVLADMDAQEVTLARELEYLNSIYPSSSCGSPTGCAWNSTWTRNCSMRPCRTWRCSRWSRTRSGTAWASVPRPASSPSAPRASATRCTCRCRMMARASARRRRRGLGLGLANTRARLKQLYGEASELRTETAPGGGAMVTMVLPFHFVEASGQHECTDR